jgi:hypothetical protein
MDVEALTKIISKHPSRTLEGWKLSPDESYSIRCLNLNNPEDIQRFYDIDCHPQTLEFMSPSVPSSPEDLDSQMKDPLLWVIADGQNKMIGWVQYYEDNLSSEERQRFNIPENALVLETSYAKLLTEKYKGVTVSGLRQTLALIKKLMEEIPNQPIFITAFTIPENISSEVVLAKNDFQKQSEQINYKDDNEMTNLWVKRIN